MFVFPIIFSMALTTQSEPESVRRKSVILIHQQTLGHTLYVLGSAEASGVYR